MPFNPAIEHHFAALSDPRIERSKRHSLLDILVIALPARALDGLPVFGQTT